MDAPEIIKSGKYLINTKTNEYYKPAKRKGLFSKVVIAICIILNDKDRKYGLAKQEVEIPREHSWYDKQQELEA